MRFFFAVIGYQMTLSKSNNSCPHEFRIDHKHNQNIYSCYGLCDGNQDCKFIFLDVSGWCGLFSSCGHFDPYMYIGDTLKKQGKTMIYSN